DPIGLLGGIRPQAYVHNPLEWVDPLGLTPKEDREASGDVKFKRWKRGEAIDKPLPDGSAPSWDTVRSRYWKNRYEASKGSGEFTKENLKLMKRGNAPLDSNGNPYELHHHLPQRNGGANVNNPINLREVTREQHAALDPYRHL
ncbi:HNH/ENDO VII family nuclease, partial [Pectobacterium versatile]